MKAVREGGSEERGRVLWDATSRGLCGRVGPPRTTVRVAWANCEAHREDSLDVFFERRRIILMEGTLKNMFSRNLPDIR